MDPPKVDNKDPPKVDGYTYLDDNCEKIIQSSNGEVVRSYRVKELCNAADVEVWLKKLMESTGVTWVTRGRRQNPNARINVCKFFLKCQHCRDPRVLGVVRSKKLDCPAKLQIAVLKTDIKRTRAKLTRYITGWPSIVTFRGDHNHPLDSADTLRYRKLSDASRSRLLVAFSKGHSPSSAFHCLKSLLAVEHGDNFNKICIDGNYVPSLAVVHHLFKKEFKNGKCSPSQGMAELVQGAVEQYNIEGRGKAVFGCVGEGHYYVSLCSNIMSRAHSLRQSQEFVMCDVITGSDKNHCHRLYVLLIPTPAGGIPLGAIITDCEHERGFWEGLGALIRDCFPENPFYGLGYPHVFITDAGLKERDALMSRFPCSRHVWSQFHLLRTVWGWLYDKAHRINNEDRIELYGLFKSVVLASSEEDLYQYYAKLLNSYKSKLYRVWLSYVDGLWEQRTEWARAYRVNLPFINLNVNKYLEISYRILRDCLFGRVVLFTVIQLFDFLTTNYEEYLNKRLLDYSVGSYSENLLKDFSLINEDISKNDIDLVFPEELRYKVRDGDVWHEVSLCCGYCDCNLSPVTSGGRPCKHLTVVLCLNDAPTCNFCINSQTSRLFAVYVATGQTNLNTYDLSQDGVMEAGLMTSSIITSQASSVTDLVSSSNVLTTVTDLPPSSDLKFNVSTSLLPSPVVQNVSPQGVESSLVDVGPSLAACEVLFERMKDSIRNNPALFVSAAQKMICSAERHARTEQDLAAAMTTFGHRD